MPTPARLRGASSQRSSLPVPGAWIALHGLSPAEHRLALAGGSTSIQRVTEREVLQAQEQERLGTTSPRDLGREVRYLPTGLMVMLARPYPWTPVHNTRLRLAQAETVLWYPLLLLALAGLPAARRRLDALAFPIVAGFATLLFYALAEGNFGTAFRHRGELVWTVALLAALGGQRIAATWYAWVADRDPV